MSPTALGLFIILIVLLQNLSVFALPLTTGKKRKIVSAEDNQIKLLVNFKIEKVTKCVGFIVKKRLIASTQTCGFTYVNALNAAGSSKMIPYSDENEIKIKDNNVAFPGGKISLMTIEDTETFNASLLPKIKVSAANLKPQHPLKYIGFISQGEGHPDKRITLDVKIETHAICHKKFDISDSYLCANMEDRKEDICLKMYGGLLFDGSMFAGFYILQGTDCDKIFYFLKSDVLLVELKKPRSELK